MRTCLPSASSANAIASCDPIESPSGRAWEVRRNRWRRRISSRICSTGASTVTPPPVSLLIVVLPVAPCVVHGRRGGRLRRALRVELLENPLDAVVLFDRLVEREGQFRHALQPEPPADVPPQEGDGALERPRGLAPRLVVPH